MKIQRIDEFRWRIPQEGRMRVPGLIYASEAMVGALRHDASATQVANVAHLPGIVNFSLAMPDVHWGYGFPIGGVAAFDPDEGGIISMGGVGFDISCGVRPYTTRMKAAELGEKAETQAHDLYRTVPAGVGSRGALKLNHQGSRTSCAMTRCPELEMGSHSVIPWIAPRTNASMSSIVRRRTGYPIQASVCPEMAMARRASINSDNEGKTYLSLRMASAESVTLRRNSMRATLSRSISITVLAVLMMSPLLSIVWHEPEIIASACAMDISDEDANVVVEFSDTSSFDEAVAIAESSGARIAFSDEETGILSIEQDSLESEDIDAISHVHGVASVASERKIRALYTPNDPSVHLQWGLNVVNAYTAWDITRGNDSVVVAILDTGIDWNHPDLAAHHVVGLSAHVHNSTQRTYYRVCRCGNAD